MSASKRLRKYAPSLIIATVFLSIISASLFRFFEVYELQTYDWRSRMMPQGPVADEIVIIEIGDASLTGIGKWPFSRNYHTALVDVLRLNGARMLGFDILFAEPSDDDGDFAASLNLSGSTYMCEALGYFDFKDGKIRANEILTPLLPNLKETATGIGHVNGVNDIDGTRRRFMPAIKTNEKQYLFLGALMAAEYLGVKAEDLVFDRDGTIHIDDNHRIPVNDQGHALVRFSAPWQKAYEHVEYLEILRAYKQRSLGQTSDYDLNSLEGKVCFVGLTATGSHDISPVPIDIAYPQLGFHADVFNNIMQQNFMQRAHKTLNLFILVILMVIALFISRIRKLSVSMGSVFLVWVTFVVMNCLFFSYGLFWMDFFYPSCVFALVYLCAIAYRTFIEQQKRQMIENELTIASKIQTSFLPAELPRTDAIEFAAYMRPAKHVGGDLYDILTINDNDVGIMCGDVSGKGMPAALFMAKSAAEFKFHAKDNSDPADVLTQLNNSLAASDGSGLFVTMNYCVYDISEKVIHFASGGANPVIHMNGEGESTLLNPDGGMPLGLMGDVVFKNLSVYPQKGDVFVLYSDGISEARDPKREEYEMDRLQAITKRARHENAEVIQQRILEDVAHFVGTAPQFDDMTVMVLKVNNI